MLSHVITLHLHSCRPCEEWVPFCWENCFCAESHKTSPDECIFIRNSSNGLIPRTERTWRCSSNSSLSNFSLIFSLILSWSFIPPWRHQYSSPFWFSEDRLMKHPISFALSKVMMHWFLQGDSSCWIFLDKAFSQLTHEERRVLFNFDCFLLSWASLRARMLCFCVLGLF